jgi:hypothetical protein
MGYDSGGPKRKHRATGRKKGPKTTAALKWSINRASREFRVSRPTLVKYLDDIGIRPDSSGFYSSMKILCALTVNKIWHWDEELEAWGCHPKEMRGGNGSSHAGAS